MHRTSQGSFCTYKHNLIRRRSKIPWSWLKVLTKWWLLLEEDLTLARRLSFLLPQHNENPLMRSFPEGTQCLNFSTVYLSELGDWQRIPSFPDDSQTFDIASSLSPQSPIVDKIISKYMSNSLVLKATYVVRLVHNPWPRVSSVPASYGSREADPSLLGLNTGFTKNEERKE